jgi:hypothetical protein
MLFSVLIKNLKGSPAASNRRPSWDLEEKPQNRVLSEDSFVGGEVKALVEKRHKVCSPLGVVR